MKMYFCFAWLMLAVAASPLAAKEMALTFDDAPRPATGYFNGQERAARLIAGLKQANVPRVAFFANSIRLDAEGKERLAVYAKAGHQIANHSHSHPNFNSTNVAAYIADFHKADELLRPLPGFVAWFRFPFLREGETLEKRDAFRAALAERHYKNAYITVNNYDWHMESLFQEAVRDKRPVNFANLRTTYVDVLVDSARYYDDMAVKVLGRSPKHVLLLHENDLAALYISDLVAALRKAGWRIITPQEAYGDDIAEYVYKDPLKFNPGRIGELAKEKGWSNDKLWHPACDEEYLAALFKKNLVY